MSTADLIFEHPRALVYCGRWQDIGLQPDSVDHVLTDPPYTEHVHSNSVQGSLIQARFGQAFAFEALADLSHVPEFLQIATRWVLCFCALEQLGDYQRAAGGPRPKGAFIRSGIWHKPDAPPQLSGDRPSQVCEAWALMHRQGGKMSWNGRGRGAFKDSNVRLVDKPYGIANEQGRDDDVPGFIREGKARVEGPRHPAQKPTALCDALATWFVNDGDLVLDPYCGSGALGMAALRRGATVIFADTDPEWAVFTADRVAAYLAEIDRTLTAPDSRGRLSV